MATQLISIDISDSGKAILDALSERKGLTQEAVIEMALSTLAKQEDLEVIQCEACGKTVPIVHTKYKKIDVRVPDPKPGHGKTIIRSGNVCKDCLKPDRWEKFQESVRAKTIEDYKNFLHYEIDADPSNIIRVILDKQANVRLLDNTNFQKYSSGQTHKYYGGLAKVSPVNLKPPYKGHWHVVIDLGGYGGSVRASVQVL